MKRLNSVCFVFLFLANVVVFAQTKGPKYTQVNYVLYRGGPAFTMDSWGIQDLENVTLCNTTWEEGNKSGGPGNLVATYHLAITDYCLGQITSTNSSLLSAMTGVFGSWQVPVFTSAISITPNLPCSFQLKEITRLTRGRWYNEGLNSIWFTPVQCDSSIEQTHTFTISEPIAFLNTTPIAKMCTNQNRIDLRNFVNDISGSFSGNGIEDIFYFNPATAALGSNEIIYTKVYDNGTVSKTLTINVNPGPAVTAGSDQTLCKNAGAILLADASPAGGTWNGQHISAGKFNTVAALPGEYNLQYTYTNENGCTGTDNKIIVVNALPAIDAGNDLDVCDNAGLQLLDDAFPQGGSWTGQGVSALSFDPQKAVKGNNILTYTYVNPLTGCEAQDNIQVLVKPATIVSAGIDQKLCMNSGPIELYGSPVGGAWQGSGVTNTTFNPISARVGTHTLTYYFTNAAGCNSSDERVFTVNQVPIVDAGSNYDLCENAAPLYLQGNPANGIWTSNTPALVEKIYYPEKENNTTAKLNYSFTDNNRCSATDEILITILSKPTASIAGNMKGCINSPFIPLVGGQPGSGFWAGQGVETAKLFTSATGEGPHQVYYIVKNSNGCLDTAEATVYIFPVPTVDAGNDTTLCQSAPDLALKKYPGIIPAAGTWTGPQIINNVVSISSLPANKYKYVYSYTDSNGCKNQDSVFISINPVPQSPVITGDLQYCFGNTIRLNAEVPGDPGAEIFWYDGLNKDYIGNDHTFNKKADTSSTLFAEALNPAFNCPSIKTAAKITVENPNGKVFIDQDTIAFGGKANFRFEGNISSNYLWTFTSGVPSIEKDPGMYFYKEGYVGYNLKVTTPLGCSASFANPTAVYIKTKDIKVISSDPINHFDIDFAQSFINIHPNPVQDFMNVEILNGDIHMLNASYSILDIKGKIVAEGKISPQIAMGHLPSGAYVLVVKEKSTIKQIKFLKY